MTEDRIDLVEEILESYESKYGSDLIGYKNHVYRMINFCFALADFNDEERTKITIAGCFHDLGIWTAGTFDYLPPSIVLATDYLEKAQLEHWIPEIQLMIDQHHRLRSVNTSRTVETFRKADLVDFSLGLVRFGLSKSEIGSVKSKFPNHGFHKSLARTACRWIAHHPLNPIPVLKW
jgi:hypothetical protein